MGSTREWVHNAQVRMVTQFNLATDDVGDKKAAVSALTGGISVAGNRIKMTGGVLSAQADKSQADAAQMGAVGADAAQKRTDAKAKSAEFNAKKAQADRLIADAKSQTTQAKAEEGVTGWPMSKLTSGKDWLLGKIAWLQGKVV
jgi:hypothetical protein